MIRLTIYCQDKPEHVSITNAEHGLLINETINVTTLIKFIKFQYGYGVYKAKSIVESVRRNHRENEAFLAQFYRR
jgi:hypothetical protein